MRADKEHEAICEPLTSCPSLPWFRPHLTLTSFPAPSPPLPTLVPARTIVHGRLGAAVDGDVAAKGHNLHGDAAVVEDAVEDLGKGALAELGHRVETPGGAADTVCSVSLSPKLSNEAGPRCLHVPPANKVLHRLDLVLAAGAQHVVHRQLLQALPSHHPAHRAASVPGGKRQP